MAFPSISDVTDAVKAIVSGPSNEATTEPTEAPTAPTEEASATATTTQEPETPAATETSTPEPLSATVSKVISEKGARAFISELPEDVRKQLGPELNKEWYTKLNERDATNRQLAAQVAAIPSLISKVVADQFDAIRMESMSDEDKKAYLERKELAELRASKTQEQEKPSEQELAAMVAQHPVTAEFWRVVQDAGLPASPDDPRVAAIWREAYHETTPEAAVAKFRSLAAAHKAQPKAPAQTDIEAIVAKQVAERLEAAVQQRLKGTLKADTGKPGGAIATGNRPKTYEEARAGAVEMLRAAER